MRHDERKEGGQRGPEGPQAPDAGVKGASDRAVPALAGRRYATGAALTSATAAPAGAAVGEGGRAARPDATVAAAQALLERHGEALSRAASGAGLPERALAAVVLAEAGQLGEVADGALAMRFEPYVFWQQTGTWVVATHRDQQAERAAFEEAAVVDASAAHVALRMGVAQLSGAEAAGAGYRDAVAMREAFEADESAQIDAIAHLASADEALADALRHERWSNLAALRAGPAYHAVGYDDALHAAALAWSEVRGTGAASYGGEDDGSGDDGDKPRRPRRSSRRRSGDAGA